MFKEHKVRDGIWHIEEAKGVYFTIIEGQKRAIIVDTGHGIKDTRSYVERKISVPYTVINSHGHPDHTQGNYMFDEVYIHPLDLPAYENSNRIERRRDSYKRLTGENELLEEKEEEFAAKLPTTMKFLKGEEVFDLGGVTVRVVELPGHTKGSVAFLVEEERLLISGDAFNPDMWMFADNHDTLETLEKTLTKALELPFDTYLGSHTTKEIRREFLEDKRRNVRTKAIDWDSYEVILGQETYVMRYHGKWGTSSITIPLATALEIKSKQSRGFNTRLLHGNGGKKKKGSYGTMLPPIFQTGAYGYESAEEIGDVFAKRKQGFIYSRINNPTVAAFEERITELEGGVGTVACASGMAAITYALLNILKSGDEFITTAGLFGGTINLFNGLSGFGIRVRYVDANDWEGLEASINENTKLIFTETIGNPGLVVTDLKKTAEIAHAHGLPFIVDNTMATAFLVKPLEWGADIVINSCSKYINGTGNSIGGVVTDGGSFIWDEEKYPQMKPFLSQGRLCYLGKLRSELLANHGGCMSPQNAFQNIVGLETLGLRLERECRNAGILAGHLSKIPWITVNYPGLETANGHEIAKKQFRNGFGSVLTIRVGSDEKAFALMNALKLSFIVANIGDIRTMVIHPASTMALNSSQKEREAAGVYDDLIRISVGIEDIFDLIADFDQAIAASNKTVIDREKIK